MATVSTDPDDRHTDTERYTRVAITLHWLIAAAILYNLASGLLNEVLPRWFFVFHISSGLTILALSIVRVVWKLTHKGPPFLPMKPWEATLARFVHFLLYAAMLLMPFSGWAMISANPPADSPGAAWASAHPNRPAPAPVQAKPGNPTTPAPPAKKRTPPQFWGLFTVPLIAPVNELGRTAEGVPEQREAHERIETFHAVGGWIMLLLLFLHVGGALKHQWIDREPELARMGLGRGRRA
jgi:cytochrome b561